MSSSSSFDTRPLRRWLRRQAPAGLLAPLLLAAALTGCGNDHDSATSHATQAGATAQRRALAVAGGQTLTVTAPSGGRVFSIPAGVDCGSACSATFETGSAVSLRAVPAPGYVFDGWEGSCSEPAACSLTMSGARNVTARFVALDPLAACTVTRVAEGAPAQIPQAHPRVLLANAELRDCLQRQMAHNHPAALRMKALVDSEMASGNNYGFEPWFAALVYQATGDARYADFAIQRTDAAVAAEEARIAAGQRADVAGDSYLYVGELIGGLATVYDWTYARLTASQRSRWIAYANQAVWNVWNPAQANWGGVSYPWSGWSIDNPSNNYYYSFLRATLLLGLATSGENAQAATWVTRFRTDKIGSQLVPTFNAQLQGGGSREGTGYGTAMRSLWELYDLWERSTGERIATLTSHTRDSLAFMLHAITPTLDRLAPTGDHARDSTAALFDYHRAYLQTLITLFPQDRLSAVAADALARSTVPRMRYSFDYVSDALYPVPTLPAASLSELSTAYWAPGTGQLAMRDRWDPAAAYANFICGPYTESHAHHDQGSFVLFRGDWLAWDGNIASSSGIEQDELQHNLVRVLRADGSEVRQRPELAPCRLLALAHNEHYTYAVADVTPVYGDSGLTRIEREFLFLRPGTVVVMDRVVTSGAGVRKLWTLNLPAAPTLSTGRMQLARGGHVLDVHGLAPQGATGAWVDGRRVEVADTTAGQSVFLHVLGTDGSVASAVRDDAAGQTGARLTLADGRSVQVRFNSAAGAAAGGTLELRAADGSLVSAGALPSGVQPPPVFAGDAPPPPPPALSVAIASPAEGSRYVAPAGFDVAVNAGPAAQLLRVELWRNGAKVAEKAAAPFTFTQTTLAAGSYRFEARALRLDGAVTVSTAVNVQVTDPVLPPASVTLASPVAGAQLTLGSPVTLDAAVQGQVTPTRIDYLAGTSVLGSRSAAPWSLSWTPSAAGPVALQARATLADGRVISSATVNVTVVSTPPPPPPAGTLVDFRQGLNSYAGVTDLGVSNQYTQYNGGKGVVSNEATTGAYRISGTGGYEVRSFLRFAGLDALRGRRVLRAELQLTFNFGASGYSLAGQYLAVPWDASASAFGWTRRDATNRWASAGSGGTDWVAGKSFTVTGFTGAQADLRTVALDVAMVQAWIDQPAQNHGMVLRPTVAGKVSWLRSSEDPVAAYRPTLKLWLE